MYKKINNPDLQSQEVICPHCKNDDVVACAIDMVPYEEYPKKCSSCGVNYFVEYEYFDNDNPENFVDSLVVRAVSREIILHEHH